MSPVFGLSCCNLGSIVDVLLVGNDLASYLLLVLFNSKVITLAVIQVFYLWGLLDFALMFLNLVPWFFYPEFPGSFSSADEYESLSLSGLGQSYWDRTDWNPSSWVVWNSTVQRHGLPWVSCLYCTCTKLYSLPPWSLSWRYQLQALRVPLAFNSLRVWVGVLGGGNMQSLTNNHLPMPSGLVILEVLLVLASLQHLGLGKWWGPKSLSNLLD